MSRDAPPSYRPAIDLHRNMKPLASHYKFNTMEELTAAIDYSLADIRTMATELYSHATVLRPPIAPAWAQYVVTAALPDHELCMGYGEWHREATKAARERTHPGLAILPRNDFVRCFGEDAVPAALASLQGEGRPMHFTTTLRISEQRLPWAIVHGGMSTLAGPAARHTLQNPGGRTLCARDAAPGP